MQRETSILRKNKLSIMKKTLLWLTNYDSCPTLGESVDFTRFTSLNKFADNIVFSHNKLDNPNSAFGFDIDLTSEELEELKAYLMKQKKFVIKYLNSEGNFPGSYLYQFYLQYLGNKLSMDEKSIFLNGYIKVINDLQGSNIAHQKRIHLETVLNI